ncbi:MAG: transcription elongation factor GreAB [Kiritimatiellia bacterium]|jgi:transcription elongation GreA/GreB family factor|nr:transcription elongation factor GreAB [Kiritimatiellia bacterium]
MRMTKKDVHQRFVEKLSAELEEISAAVRNSISMATDEAHRAESKYDTFSLESSYLARGQSQRVEELRFALDRLQALSVKELTRESVIQHGSLVRLESAAGNVRTLYFCPGGGGEQVAVDGVEVCIVTAASPLGKAVLGKRLGATFEIKIGRALQTFRIAGVE